jgi:preprotein translocase SecE subunit
MANRAVRRQQLKEPKTEKAPRNPARALGRTSTAARTAPAVRGAWYKPRWAMDIISELRKVVWPSRYDVWHLTVVVVIITIITGAVLGAIDMGFAQLIDHTLLRN